MTTTGSGSVSNSAVCFLQMLCEQKDGSLQILLHGHQAWQRERRHPSHLMAAPAPPRCCKCGLQDKQRPRAQEGVQIVMLSVQVILGVRDRDNAWMVACLYNMFSTLSILLKLQVLLEILNNNIHFTPGHTVHAASTDADIGTLKQVNDTYCNKGLLPSCRCWICWH